MIINKCLTSYKPFRLCNMKPGDIFGISCSEENIYLLMDLNTHPGYTSSYLIPCVNIENGKLGYISDNTAIVKLEGYLDCKIKGE